MTDDAIRQYCSDNNIPESGLNELLRINNSPPLRTPESNGYNVWGRYPSVLMGRTVAFESHKVELAGVIKYEREAKAYYDQAIRLKIRFLSKSNRMIGVRYVVDFVVVYDDMVVLEEWKKKSKLKKLSAKYPNRYYWDPDSETWRSPPAEKEAESLGFKFRIRCDEDINWNEQNNLLFLLNYFHRPVHEFDKRTLAAVRQICKSNLGVTLEQLKADFDVDLLHDLIANGYLYVDLTKARLTTPELVQVFTDEDSAKAYSVINAKRTSSVPFLVLNIDTGTEIEWRGSLWTVGPINHESYTLISAEGKIINVQTGAFEELVKSGQVKLVQNHEIENDCGQQLILSADSKAYRIANERLKAIEYCLGIEKNDKYKHIPARTRRHWTKLYRDAEKRYGNGYLGLLPKRRDSTNDSRLSALARRLMFEIIKTEYENAVGINVVTAAPPVL